LLCPHSDFRLRFRTRLTHPILCAPTLHQRPFLSNFPPILSPISDHVILDFRRPSYPSNHILFSLPRRLYKAYCFHELIPTYLFETATYFVYMAKRDTFSGFSSADLPFFPTTPSCSLPLPFWCAFPLREYPRQHPFGWFYKCLSLHAPVRQFLSLRFFLRTCAPPPAPLFSPPRHHLVVLTVPLCSFVLPQSVEVLRLRSWRRSF